MSPTATQTREAPVQVRSRYATTLPTIRPLREIMPGFYFVKSATGGILAVAVTRHPEDNHIQKAEIIYRTPEKDEVVSRLNPAFRADKHYFKYCESRNETYRESPLMGQSLDGKVDSAIKDNWRTFRTSLPQDVQLFIKPYGYLDPK